jgi:hypothetical protein
MNLEHTLLAFIWVIKPPVGDYQQERISTARNKFNACIALHLTMLHQHAKILSWLR